MRRRDFLKVVGITTSATMGVSCGIEKGTDTLIPYLIPPEQDVIPGVAVYKNTTCSECPANCGITAKLSDKVVDNTHKWIPIKLEGVPGHPVNDGALCIRGQASIFRLYSKNRIKSPQLRNADGGFSPVSWDEAYFHILNALRAAREQNRKNVYLSSRTTGSLSGLIGFFCSQMNIERLPEFEVFSHSAIREANRLLFNQSDIPEYKISEADFLLTLSADLLETFLDPVSFGKQISTVQKKETFFWQHIEPHASLTGFQANERIVLFPQSEKYLLAYLILTLSEQSPKKKLSTRILNGIPTLTLQETAEKTGISEGQINSIVEKFSNSRNPLLITGAVATGSESGLEIAVLTGLLQWLTGMTDSVVNFSNSKNYHNLGSLVDFEKFSGRLADNKIGVVFVSKADPLKYFPSSFKIGDNFNNATFKIGLSDTYNQTMSACDLIIPLSHTLEAWGDAEPKPGLKTLFQPLQEPLYDSVLEGDVFLELLLNEVGATEAANYQEYLFQKWQKELGQSRTDQFLRTGFVELETPKRKVNLNSRRTATALAGLNFQDQTPGSTLIFFSSVRFFDGRSQDLQLLHEIPDPLTTISYDSWISISGEQAQELGVVDEDVLKVSIASFSMELPVKITPGLAKDIFMIQRDFLDLFPFRFDPKTGECLSMAHDVKLEKTGKLTRIPILSGALIRKEKTIFSEPDHNNEQKKDGKKHQSIYDLHQHKTYRWAMVIDLESCSGCAACVAACYIENNIPLVGKQEHLMGRELSWIRIEPRYARYSATFLPMLCQHCDNAPCEAVCPVYAAYHNPEGLNAQIYNRCVGTRYCSNNCPYKVRRFNWFDYDRPEFIDLIKNPDVSIRGRGVMEKCSFCVQRIRTAKELAKDNNRIVQDGEVTPACAQTCPSNAIIFGNILDPESEVARLAKSGRAYLELEEINTQPAITYLKKRKI